MSQKATKIGLTCVVLVLAFGGLLYSTLSEGTEYYKHVDEVMADPGAWYGKNLQLHGFVQGGCELAADVWDRLQPVGAGTDGLALHQIRLARAPTTAATATSCRE